MSSPPGPVYRRWNDEYQRYQYWDPNRGVWEWNPPPEVPRTVDPAASLASAVQNLNIGSAQQPEISHPNTELQKQQIVTKTLQEKNEKLDPGFQRRPREFFKVGKVVKTLWAEPLGTISSDKVGRGSSIVPDARFGGENFITKIRWFVIIRDSGLSCSALMIQTYGGLGVGKPRVHKNSHAIVYTGKQVPPPEKNELPKAGEEGMRDPMLVIPTTKGERLNKMSRLNFENVYTLEKNWKFYDFGQVHTDFEHLLVNNFNHIFTNRSNAHTSVAPASRAAPISIPGSQSTSRSAEQSSQLSASQGRPAFQYGQSPGSGYHQPSYSYGQTPGSTSNPQWMQRAAPSTQPPYAGPSTAHPSQVPPHQYTYHIPNPTQPPSSQGGDPNQPSWFTR